MLHSRRLIDFWSGDGIPAIGQQWTGSVAALPGHDDVRRPHGCRLGEGHRRRRVRLAASTSSTPRTTTRRARRRESSARRSRRIARAGFVATKVANVMTEKPHDGGLSRRWMLRACDDSLTRLATDFIDIYYLHRDDPDTPIAETVATLGDLIRAGKIRYFGLSNYRGWRIAEVVGECEAQGVPMPVVCQPYYNLMNRMPEVEILPACDYYGIGVAPYSPLARGVLTGKYAPGGKPPEGLARRARRRADAGDGISRGVVRHRAQTGGACQEDRADARAIRAGLDVGEPDRDRASSPVRARSSNGTITSARSARRGTMPTKRWWTRSCRPAIRRRPATRTRNIRSTAACLPDRGAPEGYRRAPDAQRSPAETANGNRFSDGQSGHDQRSSYAHDGLYA